MPLFEELIQSLSTYSDCITPLDARYETARLIYNRMHDAYPGLIIRTLDVEDLKRVMFFAFKHQIALAIRGGGHHIGGFSTCNDGIVIDFSPFKQIQIDEETNTATVEPGVRLKDLDEKLSRLGYVVPSGTVSDTGLAGLTLGGGIGWLIGQYGLTCDQLCGADVLLADGRLVQAEDPAHQSLLWALRGGGGNFGIVLKFRYKLNPLPKVICGMGEVAWEQVKPVLKKVLHYLENECPVSMTVAPIFVKNAQGNPCLRVDFCCANGSESDVSKLLSLSKFITWTQVREWDYAAWQSEFDASLLPPMRGYWKASYVPTITSDMIKSLCDSFEKSPISRYTILIEHLHGAFKNYDLNTSAFPLRKSNFGIVLAARWENEKEDQVSIPWVRQSFYAIDPDETSGAYLNYTGAEDRRALNSLLSNTDSRIAHVKSYYDPENRFKKNHNVLPSPGRNPD